MEFSHYSQDGSSRMVDVTEKKVTQRRARATGFVKMDAATIEMIEKRLLPKGDVFEVARIAGIMAAKRTDQIIPMCHPLLVTHLDLRISVDRKETGIRIDSEVRLEGKTGAEMEALIAVSVASLTVYDMCKAVDKGMIIDDVRLVSKEGGKSG